MSKPTQPVDPYYLSAESKAFLQQRAREIRDRLAVRRLMRDAQRSARKSGQP